MIQIELQPEVEARLRMEASRNGEDLSSYIGRKLNGGGKHERRRRTPAEIEVAVENMLHRRARHKLPPGESIVDLVRAGRRF
jgi:hypothetical protein